MSDDKGTFSYQMEDAARAFEWLRKLACEGKPESYFAAIMLKELHDAKHAITAHNTECADICKSSDCEPYRSRGRRCPNCAMDWTIDEYRATPWKD